MQKLYKMKVNSIKPEEVLMANPEAAVFIIMLTMEDGKQLSWTTGGFREVDPSPFNGFFDLGGVMRDKAVKEYYQAVNSAASIPMGGPGKLEMAGLPRFADS